MLPLQDMDALNIFNVTSFYIGNREMLPFPK